MPDHWLMALAAGVGCALSFAATPAARRIAWRWSLLDRPSAASEGHKKHAVPTALLGGVPVVIALIVGVAVCAPFVSGLDTGSLAALGSGLVVISLTCLFDDIRGLSPRLNFAWQIGAAAVAALPVVLLGTRLELFLSWDPIVLTLITILWIVGVTNAINFLDNMDGLCAGLGAIAALFLAGYGLRTGELTIVVVAAALGGACAGFVPHNWPKARIFLGDTGSMAIGFTLASLAVMGVYTPGAELPVLAILAPLFLLAIPILDAIVVIVLRIAAGSPPWMGDRRHISHRLVRRGLRPPVAVAALWAGGAGCGFAALLLPTVGPGEAPLLIGLVLCLLIALAVAAGFQGLS